MLPVCLCVYLFFFKQKTAYEMRISDWSSDVCSSDLRPIGGGKLLQVLARQPARQRPGGLAVAVARRRVGGEPGAGQQAVQQEVEVLGHAQPLVLPQPLRLDEGPADQRLQIAELEAGGEAVVASHEAGQIGSAQVGTTGPNA